MSRQEYAPKQSEIRVTDLTRGLGEFRPKPDKPISLPALEAALKKAGYKLEQATVTVRGAVEREGEVWRLRVLESGQRFELRGYENLREGSTATLQGRWTSTAPAAGPGSRKQSGDVLTAVNAQ